MKPIKQKDNSASRLDNPRFIQRGLWIFYAICTLLVITDLLVHRHIYTSIEKIPAFYAIYGFGACVILVLLAKLMRKVLMRRENYYDDRHEEEPDVD